MWSATCYSGTFDLWESRGADLELSAPHFVESPCLMHFGPGHLLQAHRLARARHLPFYAVSCTCAYALLYARLPCNCHTDYGMLPGAERVYILHSVAQSFTALARCLPLLHRPDRPISLSLLPPPPPLSLLFITLAATLHGIQNDMDLAVCLSRPRLGSLF